MLKNKVTRPHSFSFTRCRPSTDEEDYADYPLPGYPDESYIDPEPYYLPPESGAADYPEYESDFAEAAAGPEGTVNRVRGGGLESGIFNRNERLDVKKPGPFFPNSANNFFLDKVTSNSVTLS